MKQQRSEDGPSGAQKADCDLWDEENDLPSPPKKGSYFFKVVHLVKAELTINDRSSLNHFIKTSGSPDH